MSTDTTAVETKVKAAATQSETVVTPTTTEVDWEAELAKKDAVIAKINGEKENYKRGMLKAKGKLPDEDDNSSEEDLDAKVKRMVQEQLLQTQEAEARADKDRLIAEMAKQLKETKLALKNRGQISTTSGQGSNEDRPVVRTDNVLSESQLNALKAKGWDDKKIETFKKNLNKVNEMPK